MTDIFAAPAPIGILMDKYYTVHNALVIHFQKRIRLIRHALDHGVSRDGKWKEPHYPSSEMATYVVALHPNAKPQPRAWLSAYSISSPDKQIAMACYNMPYDDFAASDVQIMERIEDEARAEQARRMEILERAIKGVKDQIERLLANNDLRNAAIEHFFKQLSDTGRGPHCLERTAAYRIYVHKLEDPKQLMKEERCSTLAIAMVMLADLKFRYSCYHYKIALYAYDAQGVQLCRLE